jgi:hypothetical protein
MLINIDVNAADKTLDALSRKEDSTPLKRNVVNLRCENKKTKNYEARKTNQIKAVMVNSLE